MHINEASKIVKLYGIALTKSLDGDVARGESLLPSDRETIVKSFKLVLANFIENNNLTSEIEENLIGSLCCIGSFIEDKKAIELNEIPGLIRENKVDSSDERVKHYFTFFAEESTDGSLRDEVIEFINLVEKLDKNDPIYHQKIYTLAGLEYSPEKKKTFWQTFLKL